MGQGPFDYCKFRSFCKSFIFAKLRIFFLKIIPSQNGKITLWFTDICKSCKYVNHSNIANMYFNAIRENRIIAKISEFTLCIVAKKCGSTFMIVLFFSSACLNYSLVRIFC